jgi:uncharacterized membrane protein YdfJ with MMPL/SSD domain
MKALQYAVIVVVCALTFVGCRSMTGRSFGQQWDDKVITSHVKSKLTTDSFHNLFSTGVGTQFGVVFLNGTVRTPAARAEAERIARRVAGVRDVRNYLVVVSPDGKTAVGGVSPATAPLVAAPAASPVTASPMHLTGQVTAIDRDSGDITVRTQTGDVMLRLPPTALRDIEQGQRLSINTGQ